ncbi:phenylacetic acid degradation protein [bacterium]|nr:MAG: phenylacetic acid degradation protein [bacterium]
MLPLLALAAMPTELDAYLRTPDPSYRYEAKPTKSGGLEIDLTSLAWQGTTWQHKVMVQQPPKVAAKGVGILYITGDGPTNGDLATLALVSVGTGMPVAMMFKVPNQPIWDLREDDLIAHTFQKYLDTGDPSWPLLFPMTKAALRAMDAVQDATKNTDNPIKRFVVCGASKRGWTTWMVGAAQDPRVIGIAPMVIDNLNLAAQMPHQLATWGEYSEQIQDYTRRGLQAQMSTPRGQKLAEMVDPYSYRERIKMPALIVRGSNDAYWTVDALDQYEKGLKMPHWLLNVPNAGHDLKGGFMAAESIGAFARSLAGGPKLPKPTWGFVRKGREVTAKVSSPGGSYRSATLWMATSDTLDFRTAVYVAANKLSPEMEAQIERESPKGWQGSEARVQIPQGKNVALFWETRYKVGGREFSLSSPTKVFKKG